jgi:hypothetical protein
MNFCPDKDKLVANAIEHEDLTALKDQLEYFVRLSQAQAEQIEQYKALQQRSHRLINSLISKTNPKQSWKKHT